MRAGPILTFAFAFLIAGLASFLAAGWLEGRASAAPPAAGTVVVAARQLAFGTPLSSQDLVEIRWAAGELPQGAFARKEDVLRPGRRAVLSALSKNEPVLDWKITGPGQRASLSALIESGMKAVTVRVDDVRGVAGFVLPGERVDVVLVQNNRGADPTSDVLMQNIRVLAVDQLANEKQDAPTIARAVTLELNTEQAQKVILASDIGKLSLILRQAGSPVSEMNRRVTRLDLALPETPPEAQQPRAASVSPSAPATVGVVRGVERSVYTVTKERQ